MSRLIVRTKLPSTVRNPKRESVKRAISQVAITMSLFGLSVNEYQHPTVGDVGVEYASGVGKEAKVLACWDMEEHLHVIDKGRLSADELALIHSHSQLLSLLHGK